MIREKSIGEKMKFDLEKDLQAIREEFPILKECTYLISNSLGAFPKKDEEIYHLFKEIDTILRSSEF